MANAGIEILSRWSTLIEGMSATPSEVYDRIEAALEPRKIPDATRERVELAEGSVFSVRRVYLRVRRNELWVDICAAPFGTGFFFSSWLLKTNGCLAGFVEVPLFGFFFRLLSPTFSYYHHDAATMFYTAVHQAVIEVVDEMTKAKGLRTLAADERRPSLREPFGGKR